VSRSRDRNASPRPPAPSGRESPVAVRLAKGAWDRSISSLPVALVALVTVLVYVLHQDFWFWRTARPLVFGMLPVGLFYHAVFTLASAALLWLLVTRMWPAHLERDPSSKR